MPEGVANPTGGPDSELSLEVPATFAMVSRMLVGLFPRGARSLLPTAASSFLAGIAESGMLVSVTLLANAIVKGRKSFDIAGITLTTGEAVGVAAGLLVLRLLFAVAAARTSTALVERILVDTRSRVYAAYTRAGWGIQSRERAGNLQDLIINQVGGVGYVADTYSSLVSALMNLFVLMLTAALIDVRSVIALGVGGAAVGLLIRPLSRRVAATSLEAARITNEYANEVTESVLMAREFRLFGVMSTVQRQISGRLRDLAKVYSHIRFLIAAVPQLYQTFAFAFVIAGLLALTQVEDTASVARLGAVVLLLMRSMTAGQGVASLRSNILSQSGVLIGVQRFVERFEASPHPEGAEVIDSLNTLTLDGVGFVYPTGEIALEDITFTIRIGENIGIVGASGSGKSTLATLLLRLNSPTSGSITADGIELADVSADSWSAIVTPVPQEPRIVTGSIWDNVSFYRDLSDDQVRRACAQAHVLGEIEGLPDGFESLLSAQGGPMSGGQRQRLCIARALATEPSVLLMDEPSSALDMESESRIRTSLEELPDSVTLVIIAHRPALLELCDTIIVLDRGRIVDVQRRDRRGSSTDADQ